MSYHLLYTETLLVLGQRMHKFIQPTKRNKTREGKSNNPTTLFHSKSCGWIHYQPTTHY